MATRYDMQLCGPVPSTQDEARRLYFERSGQPVSVVTERQTAGRGRSGADWLEAPRSIACSVALRPGWGSKEWGVIPLVAGLAARKALSPETHCSLALKWPNDVVVGGGKVAGVLVEAADGIAVVGIGINLWWPDPPPGIAAVVTDDPGPEAVERVARAWVEDLLERLSLPAADWGHHEYRTVCVTVGAEIVWEGGGPGTAVDVAADGALIVAVDGRTITLRSGAVRHVRSSLPADPTPEPGE